MNDKVTVEQAIAEVDPSIVITEYIRFELGEGIEKKKKTLQQKLQNKWENNRS